MKYAVVDNCPVPAQLAGTLTDVLRASGATLLSCYRGADAEALLHQHGKRSQAELYDGFRRGLPGFNPANPPGRSTHELRSDGSAYPGPPGRPLLWWQVGIDIDDPHVQPFIREAARRGFTVTVTYPGSRSEYHHVNFRKAPAVTLPLLKQGSRGPRVALLTRRLKFLGYLPGARWNYDDPVVAAVKKFQADHHQLVDGIAGPQTLRQVVVAFRAKKKKKT